ncbi:MAG: hypothetical protein NTW20_16055 [Rhodobacterales bacterium]|nr:hypothetical protein [Rhodobacterales bacterium]
MAVALPPGFGFAALRDHLARAGWTETRIPALLPPLIAGEPEAAAFARDDQRLDYRFNPAIRLRILDGPAPQDLPRLSAMDLPALIRSPDPATALLGAGAAAATGQGTLRSLILMRSLRMERPLARQARAFAHQLAPLCAEAAAFPDLASDRQRQCLRLALQHGSPDTADLALFGLIADPDIAATAMIAAARLGLTDLLAAFPRHADGEVRVAIRKLAAATLRGERPGADRSARNRFWHALLGQGEADMDLRLAPLVEPAPEPAPVEGHAGLAFRRVGMVPHWLGDPDSAGSARRVTPMSFLIAERPMLTCAAYEVLPALTDLSKTTGLHLRLPTGDELLCALRGTDGRVLSEDPNTLQDKANGWRSPWGLIFTPDSREFCAVGHLIHSVATSHPVTSVEARLEDEPAGLRPVLHMG